jgi:hypothetical protein
MRYLVLALTLATAIDIVARPAPKQLAAEVDKFAKRAMAEHVASALGVA